MRQPNLKLIHLSTMDLNTQNTIARKKRELDKQRMDEVVRIIGHIQIGFYLGLLLIQIATLILVIIK